MNDHYIWVEDSDYIWLKGSKIGSSEFNDPGTECKAFVQQCEDYEKRYPALNRAEDYNNWGCCLCMQGRGDEALQKKIFKKGLAAADDGHMHKPRQEEDTRQALEYNRKECDVPLLVEAEPKEIEEIELLSDEDLAIG